MERELRDGLEADAVVAACNEDGAGGEWRDGG